MHPLASKNPVSTFRLQVYSRYESRFISFINHHKPPPLVRSKRPHRRAPKVAVPNRVNRQTRKSCSPKTSNSWRVDVSCASPTLLLGGSWVVLSRVLSRVATLTAILMTLLVVRLTLLRTTHEAPGTYASADLRSIARTLHGPRPRTALATRPADDVG